MKHLKLFEKFKEKWYRGFTSNTNKYPHTWLSLDKSLAEQYAEISSLSYGGFPMVKEYDIDLSNYCILDFI